MNGPILCLVVPCYNEEAVLPITSKRLQVAMETLVADDKINTASRIMFVDDGSHDQTWPIIENLHQQNQMFMGVKLTRNRGQQNAMLAGLNTAYHFADLMITLDADLQDGVAVIEQMLNEAAQGAEIVYGVRSSRKKDTFFKRFTAHSFYKTMKHMGVDIVSNHSNCRLMSKTAVGALLEYNESVLFLQGIVPQLGYQTAQVSYERKKRVAGKSKYSLKQLMGIAVDGITSFSSKPLSMIWWLGVLFSVLGFGGLVVTLVLTYTIGLIWLYPLLAGLILCTGLILSALGVLGVYLGKIYIESKHRPRFMIEKVLN